MKITAIVVMLFGASRAAFDRNAIKYAMSNYVRNQQRYVERALFPTAYSNAQFAPELALASY